MRPMFRLLSLLVLCLVAQKVVALPAPMSEEELVQKSDLVALVRVLSVTCTAVGKDERTGEALPSYVAQLEILEVKKGDVKPGAQVLVTWSAVPKKVLGPWAVAYYPGEEVWTHLVKRSGGATYGTTWWNAKGQPVKPPEITELPTTVGQSVVAKQ